MASKIGKALGFDLGAAPPAGGMDDMMSDDSGMDDMMSEEEAPVSEATEKPSDGSAETLAMKMFEKASSPEAKVAALKAFGEACGWGGGESY